MTLLELESQAVQEGQAYTRRLLGERLQAEADRLGPVDPHTGLKLKRARRVPMHLRTTCGEVTLSVWYGYCRKQGKWVQPARIHWGLDAHRQTSPELERRMCYTAAETGSFEKASRMARVWGTPISDDAIHACVGRRGRCAQERPAPAPTPAPREDTAAMIIMMDGWMARHRGEQWGLKPPDLSAKRIHWHEIKSAVIFRLDARAQTQSGRRVLIHKHVVASPAGTDPVTFGQHVHAEAVRLGMMRAERVYVVMDGALWLWHVFEDRFSAVATGLLDFYHASEHLWKLAHEIYPDDTGQAKRWCVRLLHQLRHGQETRVLGSLANLLVEAPAPYPQAQETIAATVDYFQAHAAHIGYAEHAQRGVPIGSGAMESQCSQFQNRLKRRGQFWSRDGSANILEIGIRVQNLELDSLWAA